MVSSSDDSDAELIDVRHVGSALHFVKFVGILCVMLLNHDCFGVFFCCSILLGVVGLLFWIESIVGDVRGWFVA